MTTIYEVLRRPLVTEKSSYQSGRLNQYSFIVADGATRTQVKDAIETLYDVSVVRVNIINSPAKRGRRLRSRRLLVRKPGYKKAIVTLAEGQTLQIFEGVQ
ncbi:MAG TPA: 50S ribosomal protein L23 [Anaerolineales bacterium]|uniref:Large ribosomal subunit protein uL23 n=1 Tax=uncultured Chloroflexi bacterium Rifle_16ft_4_minimus_38663 TaxID=1665074 RepID=A0A0H4TBG8_9CHLR|nr:50S ribosomal protein L23, large subunit ribosomal protein L23 [uncultured Chloroflexi bacterium Rifle_16ft_4_minimus_38663]HLE89607.1 50S ribosomal protein L23 [Anaerolineales bacterium]